MKVAATRCHHEAKPRRETGIGQRPAAERSSDNSSILKIKIYRREPILGLVKHLFHGNPFVSEKSLHANEYFCYF